MGIRKQHIFWEAATLEGRCTITGNTGDSAHLDEAFDLRILSRGRAPGCKHLYIASRKQTSKVESSHGPRSESLLGYSGRQLTQASKVQSRLVTKLELQCICVAMRLARQGDHDPTCKKYFLFALQTVKFICHNRTYMQVKSKSPKQEKHIHSISQESHSSYVNVIHTLILQRGEQAASPSCQLHSTRFTFMPAA